MNLGSTKSRKWKYNFNPNGVLQVSQHFKVFVRLDLKWATILEYGHSFGKRSLKWSMMLKDKLCLLIKPAIRISASQTTLHWTINQHASNMSQCGINKSTFSLWYAVSLCFRRAVTTAASSLLQTVFIWLILQWQLLNNGSLPHALRYFCLYFLEAERSKIYAISRAFRQPYTEE